jgi:hypothetical protein
MGLRVFSRSAIIPLLCCALLSSASPAGAERPQQSRVASAPARATGTPATARAVAALDAIAIPAGVDAVKVDGSFNDAIWSQATAVTEFLQRDPKEGAPASHPTEVRVAFDRTAVYVAVKAIEPEPAKIVGLLTRRDDSSPSDWISIYLDSFHDKRSAYEFRVNAAGVKVDNYWYNDNNSDRSWDAVWEVAVMRSADGWQAEFRVPFSQLRFRAGEISAMGFAVSREIAHLSEISTWPLLARSATGYVSSFGELRGVRREGPQKRLEVMPFVLGQVDTSQVAEGNPLKSSPDPGATGGLDLKYQVAPGLTLAATVNPDFGQVEADPAVVNLGAFETFFSERRPFFVEGSGTLSSNDFFYSRRIGRAPQRSVSAPEGGYTDQPSNTTILGAVKLTGKVGKFAVGALHAVTSSEDAEIASGANLAVSKTPVEPTTNYSVARVSREFANNSRLSFMATSTKRSLKDELRFLPSSAVLGDIDGDWRFGGKYSISGFWAGTTVKGDAQAIDRLQRNNGHSFQRPDARSLTYDPTNTSLNGHSGGINLDKIGGTRTRFNFNAGYRSPGFEVNDLGFRSRADQIWQNSWVQIRSDVPKGKVKRKNINFNQWGGWNFDGDRRDLGGNINSHWTFVNNWSIGGGVNYNTEIFDDRKTRGGPGALIPGNLNGWNYLDTDNRKFATVNLYWEWYNNRTGSKNWYWSNGVTLRPTASLSTSVSLSWSHNINDSQWVSNVESDGRTRFVFGHLDQHTANVTVRVNYTIRPTLTVQIYGAPFASAGDYSGFKELVNGRARIDKDRYASFAYTGNPNFRIRSFRTTNVMRWEYQPGSALFVVWQQGRQDFAQRGDLRFTRDIGGSFTAPASNTFLVKMSRWFEF